MPENTAPQFNKIGIITSHTKIPYEGPILRNIDDKPSCSADPSGWRKINTEAERDQIIKDQAKWLPKNHI